MLLQVEGTASHRDLEVNHHKNDHLFIHLSICMCKFRKLLKADKISVLVYLAFDIVSGLNAMRIKKFRVPMLKTY